MPFFLGSGFLVAAAAVIVPIALHLLQRRRPRPVMFGTLRFLRDAIAQSRRAHRITQGLTLLMRILIILLLAAAFARPLLRRSGLIPAGRRTVVMIVDCSASMQTLEGGRNYFDHARSWAVALTDSLQDGDRAAVVAAGLRQFPMSKPCAARCRNCPAGREPRRWRRRYRTSSRRGRIRCRTRRSMFSAISRRQAGAKPSRKVLPKS